jgi:hypothetical protein
MRDKTNDKFQSVNGRMVLWEEISGSMYFIVVKIKEVNSIVIVLLLFTTVVWSYY